MKKDEERTTKKEEGNRKRKANGNEKKMEKGEEGKYKKRKKNESKHRFSNYFQSFGNLCILKKSKLDVKQFINKMLSSLYYLC